MKTEQRRWTNSKSWQHVGGQADAPQLVLLFGETSLMKNASLLDEARKLYPQAHLFGCSTSGEIQGDSVSDGTLCLTALQFDKAKIREACIRVFEAKDSYSAGIKLSASLDHRDLRHVLLMCVGVQANGEEVVQGLVSGLPSHVTVSGGLAGDQARFKETVVVSGTNVGTDLIAVVGFYGSDIEIRSNVYGGWKAFGQTKKIKRAKNSVLFELDDESALDIYKRFLGAHAAMLPRAGMLFPLLVQAHNSEQKLVRTVVGIDEKEQSVIFASDIPDGGTAQFLRASVDELIVGAKKAVQDLDVAGGNVDFALLVSCVGRRLLFNEHAHQEVLAVRQALGENVPVAGFYSYGEIADAKHVRACVQNQSISITTFSEK